MHTQFGSVQMVASAYEQELRADAARVRPIRGGERGRHPAPLARVRVAAGGCLVRLGGRILGLNPGPTTAVGSPPGTRSPVIS